MKTLRNTVKSKRKVEERKKIKIDTKKNYQKGRKKKGNFKQKK
jgi:hypothetical protein